MIKRFILIGLLVLGFSLTAFAENFPAQFQGFWYVTAIQKNGEIRIIKPASLLGVCKDNMWLIVKTEKPSLLDRVEMTQNKFGPVYRFFLENGAIILAQLSEEMGANNYVYGIYEDINKVNANTPVLGGVIEIRK